MLRFLFTAFLTGITLFQSFAQLSQQARDSINRLSSEDHKLMLTRLGITSLRLGP